MKRKPGVERPHFRAVLGFVHRNRFAVASQIRRRFPKHLRSDRTTRRHLEEMEALGYLAVAPTRSVGPLFPKVYYVTGRGVRKLKESLAAKGKSWEAVRIDRRSRHSREGYSADQVLHELLITEFLLAVWQTVQGRPDLELLTIQRRSLAKHPAFRVTTAGRSTRLIPDAMFLFRQVGGGMIYCFVEVDTGTMNRKQIEEKYRRYEAWSRCEVGQQFLIDLYRRYGAADPRPNFRVLMIAEDRTDTGGHRRMRDLHAASLKLPRSLRDRLWFTTVGDLERHQHDPLPLGAAIWLRGRDAWSSGGASGTSVRPAAARLESGWLAGLPLHPLFPVANEQVVETRVDEKSAAGAKAS